MFRKALQFRAVCAKLTGQAAGGERADDMKDKVIKPPIPKKISIALMILFGVMAISILTVKGIMYLKRTLMATKY